jgi:23S rRNA U2552 (ribose-2'-O)-methylase RlmE/FtsJ
MENKKITGFTLYKSCTLQQHNNYSNIFTDFLKEIKPSSILEIGTGAGGFTLFLRNTLNEIGLENCKIQSFDINPMNHIHIEINNMENIEILKDNIFSSDNNYTLINPHLIESFIKNQGTTLVLCDGGNKVKEFNQIAKLIKPGDYIMAHDYVDNIENFTDNYLDKIWNWVEISDADIKDICEKENLVSVNKNDFDSIVWVCKQKI